MLISHKESSAQQTNSILSSYYKDTDNDYNNLVKVNSKLLDYQKRVNSSIGKINTAILNYFKAAQYLYLLEKRLAEVLHMNIDWTKTGFAKSWEDIANYDIDN